MCQIFYILKIDIVNALEFWFDEKQLDCVFFPFLTPTQLQLSTLFVQKGNWFRQAKTHNRTYRGGVGEHWVGTEC